MSLIHQALKKLEGIKHGYGGADEYVPEAPRRTGVLRAPVLYGFLLVAAILAGITLYTNKGRVSFAQKGKKTPAPIAAKAPEEPKQARPLGAEGAGAHNLKGINLYKAGQYMEAAEEFRAALAVEAKEGSKGIFYNNLGLAYMGAGESDRAEGAFKEALVDKPDYPEAANNYGALLATRGQYAGAVALLKKAVALRPSYADAQLNLAVACENLNRVEESLSHYEKYLRLVSSMASEERNEEAEAAVKTKIRRIRSGLIFGAAGG